MPGLEIRFQLATPMRAPEQPIHLDGVLAWAAVDEAGGDFAAQDDLPLELYESADGRRVWKASRLVLDTVHRQMLPMFRTFEPWQWGTDRGEIYRGGPNKLHPGTGPYKAYQMAVPLVQVASVRAWCIGQPERIGELLARVTHLGKLARLDMGRVAGREIVPCDQAHERWKWRTMPEPMPGYRPAVMTLMPPYWRREARTLAWEPTAALMQVPD